MNEIRTILGESKHTLTPSYIFSGVKTPNQQDLCPSLQLVRDADRQQIAAVTDPQIRKNINNVVEL